MEAIREETGKLKLDDSLLFLNHLLAVSRGDEIDPALEPILNARKSRAPAFVIHFIAKQLLLHGSNLCPYVLDGPRFLRLMDLYFRLDDPIVNDPNWKNADPTGFFERLLGQQIPSQQRNLLQKIGLALGLFRDTGLVQWPTVYDLKADIEGELGVSIELFLKIGHAAFALRRASLQNRSCSGTFDHMYLVEAFRQGFSFCTPEVWSKFLVRVACNRDTFREVCNLDIYRSRDAGYAQFEFNPLCRYPIIDIGGGRFVAVDPDLIIERTTLGLFYDLFERYGTDFVKKRFGYAFDQFIGKLLGSVCAPDSLWWASTWERTKVVGRGKKTGRICDWAFVGQARTVLFECKSLRPSLELLTYGSDESVRATVERLVDALEQLIDHGTSIQSGAWADQGLAPRPVLCVVVTYGHIRTVNGPFVRRRIKERLLAKGKSPLPFTILSLQELDSVIRLVELGHQLDEVIRSLSEAEDSFNPLQQYSDELKDRGVSTFAYTRGSSLIESITEPCRDPG